MTKLPLKLMSVGKNAIIIDIDGGYKLRSRLMEMGFNRGTVVKVIRNDHGPLIVGLGENRMVLGCGMAQKIWVEEITNAS